MMTTNVQTSTVYAAAAPGGGLVHRTKTGIPYLLVQLDNATKLRVAEVYGCDADLLENSNRNFTARLVLDGERRIDPDTGIDTWVDGPMASSLANKQGAHTVTATFTAGKLRSWMIPSGPMVGEIRYDITLASQELQDVQTFNIFDFAPGTFRLPVTPMRRPSRLMAAVEAGSPTAAERVAAAATELASSPM